MLGDQYTDRDHDRGRRTADERGGLWDAFLDPAILRPIAPCPPLPSPLEPVSTVEPDEDRGTPLGATHGHRRVAVLSGLAAVAALAAFLAYGRDGQTQALTPGKPVAGSAEVGRATARGLAPDRTDSVSAASSLTLGSGTPGSKHQGSKHGSGGTAGSASAEQSSGDGGGDAGGSEGSGEDSTPLATVSLPLAGTVTVDQPSLPAVPDTGVPLPDVPTLPDITETPSLP